MYCANCGTVLPDDANFCSKCGTPLRNHAAAPGEIKYEYKDLHIPLNLSWSTLGDYNNPDRAFLLAFDSCILKYLQQEATEGWRAAEPYDYTHLLEHHNLELKMPFLSIGTVTAQSATIRLKRIVPK